MAAALSLLTTILLKNVSKPPTPGRLTSRRNLVTSEGAGRGMLLYSCLFFKKNYFFLNIRSRKITAALPVFHSGFANSLL